MWKWRSCVSFLLLFVAPGICAADPPPGAPLVAPDPLTQGGTFSTRITNAPPASSATVRLVRNGTESVASDVRVDSKTTPGVVEVSAKTPDNIAAGDYLVLIQLDSARSPYYARLRVRPPGVTDITLNKFDPDHTYKKKTVWPIANPEKKSPAVRLTLTGAGFAEPGPDKKAGFSIWINNRRAPVVWDQCPEDEEGALPDIQVHGQFISPEQVVLCRVPVPDSGRILVSASYSDAPGMQQTFTVYRLNEFQVAFLALLITAALTLLVLFVLFGVGSYVIVDRFKQQHRYRMRKLFLDPETNTYSLSKFQFYLWTAAALFAYAYLYISKVLVQHLPWPDIPGSLPGIVGIGAATAVGSQVVTATMGSKGAGAELPSPADFLTSGGVAAPDRIQMFLWTIFGVGAFCVGVLQNAPGTIRDIAPIPEGMLYMAGLSAAGYLGGKMARKPGPVISEISMSPPDPDDVIAQSAADAAANIPELAQVATPARATLAALPPVTSAGAQTAVDSLKASIQATSSTHTTNDMSGLITNLAKFRAEAERGAETAAADFARNANFRQDAQTAQTAAAMLQDLAADVTAAISQAAAPVMQTTLQSRAVVRSIEIRGTGFSPDATFDIDHTELPFRMLTNSQGQNAPEVVARQDGGTFARILRLTIDPSKLAATDLAQYANWFGATGVSLFTITNPDGQKAELSFSMPPAAAQKSGEAGERALAS
jgi:hypothetical protein